MKEKLKQLLADKMQITVAELEASPESVVEFLSEEPTIHSEVTHDARWWTEWTNVVSFTDGDEELFVAYPSVVADGDRSPRDLGYELDGLDKIYEVTRKEVVKFEYSI